MQKLVNAVRALIIATPALAAFAGVSGPFWEIAPERKAFPYVVITQIGGTPLNQGFPGIYVEPVHLQFTVRDTDLDRVMTFAETFCAAFDAVTSLSLAGSEITRRPLRVEAPRFITEGIDETGRRVYAGIIQYRFSVQRTRGS